MDEATKKKLAGIIDQKKGLDAAAAEAATKKAEEARKLAEDRAATDKRWTQTTDELRGAIASVNEVIAGHDMHFEMGSLKKGDNESKFGGLSVYLRSNTSSKERYVHFNVSDVGIVSPVFLIPHSGKNPNHFTLFDGSEDKYAAILTDFLAQIVEHAAKGGRR